VTAVLPLRNCAECGVCYQPHHPDSLYCTPVCTTTARNMRRAARKREATASRGGAHVCGDCGATFASGNALGGHRTRTHVKPVASTRVRLARVDHNSHPCSDCGQPCSSASQLDAHRGRHHRAVGTIPTTVRVLKSLTFTCPDCGREYDDSNRLAHHRRELHDPPHRAAHEVAVALPMFGTRIA